jgi:hypothetical protein
MQLLKRTERILPVLIYPTTSERPVIELIREIVEQGMRPVWRQFNGQLCLVGLPE